MPDQGSNLGPLLWESGVLATGLPGKSLNSVRFIEHLLRPRASLVPHLVKNLFAMQKTLVRFLGHSTGEGVGYLLQYSWASLVASW